jgi:phospholipid/cholesterol/gamma-HCH transport system substrate-binding protein
MRLPRSNVALGIIALAVIAVAVYLGVTKEIPFRGHYEVRAAFASANNIRPGSPVRIAGVEVGKVKSVERAHAGAGRGEAAPGDEGEARSGAIVTMRIQDKGRPIHTDATAKIRPRIFLEGNFFVDMTAGSPSAPELEDGATIPVQQTATPVQLDQVLTALQSDTRDELKTLLREYGKGLDGAGAKGFNHSIPYWEPAYKNGAIVSDAMRGETGHDLSGYIKNAGEVAAALDRNRAQLKSLVTDFNTTAAAFASQSDNLSAAIGELPRTLRAAYPALGALNAAFPPLRALAVELRPGVENSSETLDAAIPFVHQLRGLVSENELRGLSADLRPAVPDLARLVDRSIPLYREVRRASSCQNEVIHPWTLDKVPDKQFPAEGPVYQEAPKPLPGLAGESRSADANGSWFRVLAAGGKNLVTFKPGLFATTPEPLLGANPPKPTKRPPINGSVPCETQQPPDLRTNPGAPPPQHSVDTSSPAFKARYALARGKAITWLRKQLEDQNLENVLKVVTSDATPQLLGRIAGGAK